MNRVQTASLAVASIACAVVASAAPAFAATKTTYLNGFFQNRLDSRELNSGDEGYWTYRIDEASCPGTGNLVDVRLVEERFHGDKNYAWKSYLCSATGGSKVWNATSDGDHHLTWEKGDTNSKTYNWYVSGNADYPG